MSDPFLPVAIGASARSSRMSTNCRPSPRMTSPDGALRVARQTSIRSDVRIRPVRHDVQVRRCSFVPSGRESSVTQSDHASTDVRRMTRRRREPQPTRRRWPVAVTAAAVAGAATSLALGSGVLRGPAFLTVLILVALAVPSSRELSRRVVVVGCVFLGWLPFVWWWQAPSGVSRVGVLLVVLTAVLVGWTFAGSDLRSRARILVPRVRPTDALVVLAGMWATWMNLHWLRVTDPAGALTLMLRGWDHSAHFDIAMMIRRHGTVISHVPVGPLGEWSYTAYPQSYHATVATLMEVLAGPRMQSPSAEVVTYSHAMALSVVIAVVTVIAALCSLPSLRRRPLLAAPAVGLVVSAFTLGPGGRLIDNGFPNFYVACALVASIPLVVIPLRRLGSPLQLAVLGGAVVGVAHNWALLLTLAAPAGAAMVFPVCRSRWPGTGKAWLAPLGVAAATMLGVGAAAMMLQSGTGLAKTLVIDGEVGKVPIEGVVVTVISSVVVCLSIGSVRLMKVRASRHDDATRTMWLSLMPLAGTVVALGVAYLQIHHSGHVSYYFWKYVIALQLLATVMLVAAIVAILPLSQPVGSRSHRWRQGSSALGLALAVSQVYGLATTSLARFGFGDSAPGAAARSEQSLAFHAPTATARSILESTVAVPQAVVPVVLLPFFPFEGSLHPTQPAQWLNALSGRWSEPTQGLLRFADATQRPEVAIAVARSVLAADDKVVVLVGPAFFDAVRDGLADDGWSDRIATW